MTPDQERKLDHLVTLVVVLTDAVHDSLGRISALERWRLKMKRWVSGPMRDPMPTIDPDASGSIEAKAFGMGLKASGRWPVWFAMGFIAIGTAIGCMVAARH